VTLSSVGIGSAKGKPLFGLNLEDLTAPDPATTFPYELQPQKKVRVSADLPRIIAFFHEHGNDLGDQCNVRFVSATGQTHASKPIKTAEMLALLSDPDFWAKEARKHLYLERALRLTFPESWKTPKTPPG
jgi:hypothetical protein